MKKLIDFHDLTPTQILSLGYIVVILIGAILLTLPIATTNGEGMNFLNATFTATSATAVTGLIVENTSAFFTLFGQLVIMGLIQIGGLGIMTMSTLVALILGKKISLKHRLMVQRDLDQFQMSGLFQLVKYVVVVSFTIEGVGAGLLFIRLVRDMPVLKAIYYAIFHSVSAFNNAGFDIFGNSLMSYPSDIMINLTMSALIILGGLGFAVIAEVYDGKRFINFSLQTKLVLSVTAVLLVIGFIGVFILEYSNPGTLGQLPFKGKILASWFLSVTPRTAGFSTVPTGALNNSTLFFIIVLMFIGASPGSTGGGIKTTTVGALGAVLLSRALGIDDVDIFKRRLSRDIIFDAISVFLLALALVVGVTTILTITEEASFLNLLFESVSAFGTVGLSTGVTDNLSAIGRIVIIITMFAGRVGPLTVVLAIAEKRHKVNIRYPKEKILVG